MDAHASPHVGPAGTGKSAAVGLFIPDPMPADTELVDVPLDSPMSQKELDRLAECEKELSEAFREQLKAEIEHGRTLAELKDHPRMLWQRDPMFRTKSGGWKKRRDWHQYVVNHGIAESGKEADRMIQLWHDHKLHTSLAQS